MVPDWAPSSGYRSPGETGETRSNGASAGMHRRQLDARRHRSAGRRRSAVPDSQGEPADQRAPATGDAGREEHRRPGGWRAVGQQRADPAGRLAPRPAGQPQRPLLGAGRSRHRRDPGRLRAARAAPAGEHREAAYDPYRPAQGAAEPDGDDHRRRPGLRAGQLRCRVGRRRPLQGRDDHARAAAGLRQRLGERAGPAGRRQGRRQGRPGRDERRGRQARRGRHARGDAVRAGRTGPVDQRLRPGADRQSGLRQAGLQPIHRGQERPDPGPAPERPPGQDVSGVPDPERQPIDLQLSWRARRQDRLHRLRPAHLRRGRHPERSAAGRHHDGRRAPSAGTLAAGRRAARLGFRPTGHHRSGRSLGRPRYVHSRRRHLRRRPGAGLQGRPSRAHRGRLGLLRRGRHRRGGAAGGWGRAAQSPAAGACPRSPASAAPVAAPGWAGGPAAPATA
jgi:hypothetical protein